VGAVNPVDRAISNVWTNRVKPIPKGWFIKRNMVGRIIVNAINKEDKITEISL